MFKLRRFFKIKQNHPFFGLNHLIKEKWSLILAKSQVSNFKADGTNNGNINYIVYTTQCTH